VTIGCHTHAHLLLDREPASVVEADLDRSIELLTELTGSTPGHFAYPKALAPSAENDVLIRDRFASAAVAGTRPNRVTRPHRPLPPGPVADPALGQPPGCDPQVCRRHAPGGRRASPGAARDLPGART
jgi:peptidoglycan/xylan/chitin deacetylase (PgdA/CDA1 family)